MSPSAPTLRQILTRHLTSEDFNGFCLDHFPQVHHQFTAGQTYDQRIRLLLQHVRTYNQLSQLYNYLIHDHPHISAHLPPLSSDLDTLIPSADLPSSDHMTHITATISNNTIGNDNIIAVGTNISITKNILPPPDPVPQGIPHNLPTPSTVFVGREEPLRQLHAWLHPGDPDNPVLPLALTAVQGQGGLGKTELAAQYARRHAADYPGGLHWQRPLNASLDTLAINLLNFARDRLLLKVPDDDRPPSEKLPWLWTSWRPPGPALLIFDNVDDATLPAIHALLDTGLPHRLRVLVTTRIQLIHGWQVLPLDTLSPEASAQLFRKLADLPDGDLPDLPHLCQRLGHLPLALELVALYYLVNKSHLTLPELIRNIEKQTVAADALNQLPTSARLTAKLPVQAAFALSWNLLPPDAKLIACRLALFANAPVPAALFLDTFPPDQRSQVRRHLADPLVRLSLIKSVKPDSYLLHPLLRDYYRHQLDHKFSTQKRNFSTQVAAVIVKECQKIPQTCTLPDQARFAPVAPHAAEVAEHLYQCLSVDDLGWPGTALASFHRGQSAWKEAESWLRRTLALCDTTLGPEHSHTLGSLNNLALLLQAQGDLAEAEPLYRRALEAKERVLGPEHPATLNSLNSLAALLYAKGDLVGAEPLFRRALEAQERVLDPEHPDTLSNLNNFASLLQAQGDLVGAEPLFRRALEAQERVLGPEHPDTLSNLNNLAHLLQAKSDLAGAEPLYRRALETSERTLGPEHPYTLKSLNNLALLLQAQGNFFRAEPLYRRALETSERVLGPEHPDTLISVFNLALFLVKQQKFGDAVPLLCRVLEAGRRVLPKRSKLRLAIEDVWTQFQDAMAQSGG